ncbi:MAG: adenylyltransferase/cytidyltransferase family protein [Trichococcus flocculiformis]
MGNLYKDKLSGSRIGIVFGAFAPCHIGHLEVILKAKKENDGCVVIVCGQEMAIAASLSVWMSTGDSVTCANCLRMITRFM